MPAFLDSDGPVRKSGGSGKAGTVWTCEIRDQSSVGAGWEVLILMDGEPQFSSRRCVDESDARRAAAGAKHDNLRGGWTDITDGEKEWKP